MTTWNWWETTDKEQCPSIVPAVVFYALVALLMLMLCCGCSYAFIHKRELTEFRALYNSYRGFVQVKPVFDADLVNKGADSLDRTLKLWIGEWKDADK